MSALVSIQLDASEPWPQSIQDFCGALVGEIECAEARLRDFITRDFSWLGHHVGWDWDRIRCLISWMKDGAATFENVTLLSASVLAALPEWSKESAFGGLVEGDRIALFDLRRGEDVATIAAVLCTRGPHAGRVRRTVDPAAFARLIELGRALSGHPKRTSSDQATT
jgi:hypothetical protein